MMTNGERNEGTTQLGDAREARRARRIADLYADDPAFQKARPIPEVIEAVGKPGLRLTEILETLVEGYADRPALAQRARELVTDTTTGRTSERLLPSFETISYREVWDRVSAIATALRNDSIAPVNPGDFVATIGFSSPEYLTVDLAGAYLGLVSVPLQHNAPVSQLRPIIAETEPKLIAVGAEYLDLAVESALESTSLRRLLVFDYRPAVDDQRESLERAPHTQAVASTGSR
jgi:fatty acid CoA ligase FadD9